jgi:pimeloyl-ACP methyl ester carboxylesterase
MEKAAGVLYEDIGKPDGEPVLMIHGGVISDAFMPLSREPLLAARYRMVWYRRPGYGGSDYVEEAKTSGGQVAAALSLMQKLGIERAHVIGHSGGVQWL